MTEKENAKMSVFDMLISAPNTSKDRPQEGIVKIEPSFIKTSRRLSIQESASATKVPKRVSLKHIGSPTELGKSETSKTNPEIINSGKISHVGDISPWDNLGIDECGDDIYNENVKNDGLDIQDICTTDQNNNNDGLDICTTYQNIRNDIIDESPDFASPNTSEGKQDDVSSKTKTRHTKNKLTSRKVEERPATVISKGKKKSLDGDTKTKRKRRKVK